MTESETTTNIVLTMLLDQISRDKSTGEDSGALEIYTRYVMNLPIEEGSY